MAAEYDIKLTESFSVAPTVGIGSAAGVGLGWNVGVQGFYGDQNGLFRIGLGTWYGINGVVVGRTDDYTASGVTVGLTPRWQLGQNRNHLINLHLMYAVTTNYDNPCDEVPAYLRPYCSVEETDDVKVGIGYMYKF